MLVLKRSSAVPKVRWSAVGIGGSEVVGLSDLCFGGLSLGVLQEQSRTDNLGSHRTPLQWPTRCREDTNVRAGCSDRIDSTIDCSTG